MDLAVGVMTIQRVSGLFAVNESLKTRLLRFGFNHFPAFRRTGARIIYIAADFREVLVKLPLNWKTRNNIGTMFGDSMSGAVDGIYMMTAAGTPLTT